MNHFIFTSLLFCCALFYAQRSQGQETIVTSNAAASPIGPVSVFSGFWLTTSFTTANSSGLDSVDLRVNQVSTTSPIEVWLYEDMNSQPGTRLIELSEQTIFGNGFTNFRLEGDYELPGNTTFWIVARVTEGAGQYNLPRAADSSQIGPGSIGDALMYTLDEGESWTSGAFPLIMTVYSRLNNEKPTAVAGDDQSIRAGDSVFLDGSASFDDNTDPASLAYSWIFLSKPVGSTADFDDPAAIMPSFVADAGGSYSIQLVVTDESGSDSLPDQVTVSSSNLAPTATATSDFSLAIIGEPFTIDGTGSNDPESDAISYFWTMAVPIGSAATLDNPTGSTPSFTPDVEGTYQMMLVVSDFIGPGDPVFLDIVGSSAEEFAESVIVDTADIVDQLDQTQITTEGNSKAFNNFLSNAISSCQKGKDSKAIATLQRAIERVDGCALRGVPDGNGKGMDWVTDCDEQLAIYTSLTAALDALSD